MKHKGFTLIELLAVIVILAIIAVIAIPRILNVVEEAKRQSAISSALGYIDAVEKQIMINATSKKNAEITDNTYPVPLNPTYGVTVKGKVPSGGEIIIEKGKVKQARFVINGYGITCQNDKCRVTGTSSSLSSIAIKTMPTKTSYADSSELLDLTGLEVEAIYGDGTKVTLNSNEFTTSQENNTPLTKLGNNPITVSYTLKGVTKITSFNVVLEKMAIEYSASNTLDYKGYNGNLADYIYTTRIAPSNGRPSISSSPWIVLPDGVEGNYLNVKYMLDQTYSAFLITFCDSSGNVIGKNHNYLNSTQANDLGRTSIGTSYGENSMFLVEDIQSNNVSLTAKLEIPEGTKYVLIWMDNTNHGAKIYDTYLTVN